jgi:hypothetical protein
MWLPSIYFMLTLITCVQAMINSSFRVGGAALLGCTLCYFGTAGFTGSFRAIRAQQMKNYSARDLAGIGAGAVLLNAGGLALIIWSGFWVGLFGVAVQGVYWALLGILIATLTTKKEHALM